MSITDDTKRAGAAEHDSTTQTQPQDQARRAFPADFLWGAASSAYQVEGATREDGRSMSIWDRFVTIPGAIYEGQTGDIAADHYHLMEQDVALMARLGLSAYRFSIAWPRILPDGTGSVNAKGLDFYDRLVDALLARGIQPLATLHHWDLPLALQERGGWLKRDTAYAFADYAGVVARRLGDRVKWWLTHNEPWCIAYLGYGLGMHAPGIQDVQMAVIVGHHVLLSHGLAVPRLRTHTGASAQIGIAIDFYPVYAADDRPETLAGVEKADAFRNRWFLDPIFRASYPEHLFANMGVLPPPIQDTDLTTIATPIDFLGVNYYSRLVVRGLTGEHDKAGKQEARPAGAELNQPPAADGYEAVKRVPGSSYTEMGSEIYPAGLANILTRIYREYAPKALLVTESGAAFDDQWDGNHAVHDSLRTQYLREHIATVQRVVAQGVPVKGYFVWSLTDNFEWSEGYSKRFGLVYIDYPTQRRIIKDSGYWYASFLAAQKRT
ncbi:MAG TPA: GH1 family beta-glucosidase [Ktedonobacteraceae bacterium]|jgi:beta-glucosidase|nr:GH1 family beta-glucosidase [Ktedonobacteraceae bacterium]